MSYPFRSYGSEKRFRQIRHYPPSLSEAEKESPDVCNEAGEKLPGGRKRGVEVTDIRQKLLRTWKRHPV